MAVEQSFDEIRSYKFPTGTVYKRVQCSVPTGRFSSEFSFDFDGRVKVVKSGGYVRFDLEGYLNYASGGMVFGVLPIPEAAHEAGQI